MGLRGVDPQHRNRGLIIRALLLGAALFAVLAIAAAPRAHGGTYNVIECQPFVDEAADATKDGTSGVQILSHNYCVQGGPSAGYGLELKAVGSQPAGGYAYWAFWAIPGTTFARVDVTAHVYFHGSMSVIEETDQGLEYIGAPSGTDMWVSAGAGNTSKYVVQLKCESFSGCNSNSAYAYLTNYQFQVNDLTVPTVTAGPSSLLAPGTKHGVESLQLSAGDVGGGVRHLRVTVNGITSRNLEQCGAGPYRQFRPCPAAVGPTALSIDTEGDPGWVNGPNDVRICSHDVSGNESGCIRQTVQVDNSCPGSGGAQSAAELESGIESGGRLRPAASVKSNQRPVIRGTLRNGAGQAVSGASVCVFERVDLPDGSRELVSTATTQGNGRFATTLDPGPSRTVEVVYRFNNQVMERQLELNSKVVPKLRVSDSSLRNGENARFKGALPGPNAESRAVALQAKAGRKWRTFKQLRTNEHGRFKAKYPFRHTTGKVRYRFRALVKRQGGYPFEPGASKKKSIVVRG